MRIISLVGWSDSGKTSLLTRVIPILTARGVRVSTIKKADNNFDVDVPSKDSHIHRMAGATEVLVCSSRRWALMHELREEDELSLDEILARLSPVDLVIVEGYTDNNYPKIEVFHAELGKPPLYANDHGIVAVASDAPLSDAPILVLDLTRAEEIANILLTGASPSEWPEAEEA